METQEGIYLGKGKVAFVSADNGADVVEKLESHPKIDTLGNFLGDSAQELKVVDHCFRQFDPKKVVQIIKTLLEDEPKKTSKNHAIVSSMALELKNLLKNIKTTDAIVLLLKLIIFGINKFVKL
uniref:Uncharacterized protein n=1 Tax=Panagrolaimus sp. JU765 TaxID=591449 RepID=A0AC34RTJ8_9BILA